MYLATLVRLKTSANLYFLQKYFFHKYNNLVSTYRRYWTTRENLMIMKCLSLSRKKITLNIAYLASISDYFCMELWANQQPYRMMVSDYRRP